MLACGMLLYFLFPRAVHGMESTIARHPGRSLLAGLALLFTVPPVAVLCMVTVIGLPIGLALFLLYPLLLLLGYLGTAFFVSRRIAVAVTKQSEPLGGKKQLLYLAVALLLLSLALAVPFFGGLVLFLAVIVGMGGFAVWTYLHYRTGVR